MRVPIIAAFLAACGGSQDIEAARNAAYDTDRAVVFREALTATESLFPSAQGDEAAGTIATAWHQVGIQGAQSDTSTGRLDMQRVVATQNFVRFDVAVTGGPPWRVTVTGHGNERRPGTDYPSAVRDDTSWVTETTNRLVVRIHDRLAAYAR